MLSATDIEIYRTCPLRYKFARVYSIPREQTLQQRFGILVHQVLERFHTQLANEEALTGGEAVREPTPDTLMALFETGWRRQGFGESNEERQLHEKAVAALERYHERFAGEEASPVWFERSFSFRIGPHLLRGRVDRVDRHPDGSYELIDYKTGRARTPSQLKDDIQLSLYQIGAKESWKLESSRQSYYYVLDDEKVPLEPTEEDVIRIKDTATEVASAILAQQFEPKPSYSACSTCDFQLICPAAERVRSSLASVDSPCFLQEALELLRDRVAARQVAERDVLVVHLLLEPLDQRAHLGLARDRLVEPALVLHGRLVQLVGVDRHLEQVLEPAAAARASPSGSAPPRRSAAPAPRGWPTAGRPARMRRGARRRSRSAPRSASAEKPSRSTSSGSAAIPVICTGRVCGTSASSAPSETTSSTPSSLRGRDDRRGERPSSAGSARRPTGTRRRGRRPPARRSRAPAPATRSRGSAPRSAGRWAASPGSRRTPPGRSRRTARRPTWRTRTRAPPWRDSAASFQPLNEQTRAGRAKLRACGPSGRLHGRKLADGSPCPAPPGLNSASSG